jgi:hypothetical protein
VELRYARFANAQSSGNHLEGDAFEVVPSNDIGFPLGQETHGALQSNTIHAALYFFVRRRHGFVNEAVCLRLRQIIEAYDRNATQLAHRLRPGDPGTGAAS